MRLAMEGLKILDFSQGIAGPHASLLCSQHGADVVKIEPPAGDWCRGLGTPYGDLTAHAVFYNRGKRSICLDMKEAQALSAVREMMLRADVVVESFRPGVMAKFGLDYATIERENPGLIYISVNGFGSTGPLSESPVTDTVIQGFSGLMFCNADVQGEPQRIDLVLVDITTGMYAYQAISTALLERERFGARGQHIECTLLNSAVALQAGRLVEDLMGGSMTDLYHPVGVFATSDGHFSMTIRKDEHFAALCEALGRGDLIERFSTAQLRRAHKDELLPIVRSEIAMRTFADISASLTKADILHSRVQSHSEMLAHPQSRAANVVTWCPQHGVDTLLPIAATPGAPTPRPEASAPHLGQHTSEAMRDWGVSSALIEHLCQSEKPSTTQ